MNGFPDVWAEGEDDDVDSSVSQTAGLAGVLGSR